ncbi:hypothetical protein HU200_004142 [Digitaria exilis]|uniref:DUF4220 domain-containing protein n=1 Tax=Digitaria exilis TaxID=1010633 RepID=A0A835KSH0_9POAL|nr:hypothetical protein HU200_004142 [Digitaria exilis]CAB3469273.1 unnamed protein product [Digitaria exilis]
MDNFSSCNATVQSYVFNLTSSYADQRNEATMVATSVVMFSLATLFFNLNLFSRPSDISAILNPSVRLFLRTSLSLFLPVMSYLFSEAKNKGAATAAGPMIDELSLRARVILIWMILVELLRKKAEAILGGMQGWTGTIERASRIAWLGYLVFYNLRSAGKRALYGILWVFVAAKLVQRVVTLELAKRSFAYGKNPALVSSYMAQILKEEQHAGSSGSSHGGGPSGSELLKRCNYVVAGEEDLVKKAGPHGYDLQPERLMEDITKVDSTVITVGKIWRLAETDKLLRGDSRLKRLCLSFALFKLLRRRLEDFPITDAEAQNCRGLIFRGLCQQGREPAAALFQVFNDEVQFLCEYYHSVNPVVLASPFFFLANYILFPIVVWAICVFVIILCSNGDVAYAFHSFSGDNYAISFGLMKMFGCILGEVGTSPQNLFSTVDISITILLFLSVAYEEVWEFFLFLLSNWLMVSLLCSYTSFRRWRESPLLSGIIRRILWVRNKLSHPSVSLKQLSLLWFCRFSMALPTKAVPIEAKKAIMDRLARVSDAAPLSNGSSVLPRSDHDLSKACESDSIAEVILTWHIATALLEAEHPVTKPAKPGSSRKVAMALSRYCAYLVAFQPELLPDDKDGTERVYKEMTEELKEIWCPWYYWSGVRARARKLKEIIPPQGQAATTPLLKGAKLGKILSDRHTGATADDVWKLLADLWTEVMVYAAPTGSELHAKAHKEALAQGGEFITVLWALTTHTGIARAVPTTHTGIARVPPVVPLPESV